MDRAHPVFSLEGIAHHNQHEVMEFVNTQNAHLLKQVDKWLGNGSGWTVKQIDGHWEVNAVIV